MKKRLAQEHPHPAAPGNGTGHKVQPQRGLNRIESAWFGCYPFAGRVAAPADIVNMAPPTG